MGGLLGALLLATLAQVEESRPLDPGAPRRDTAEQQLAHACGLKGARPAPGDPALRAWFERTVQAYRAVRVHHPQAGSIGAEAAFRAAELLRAFDRPLAAIEEFEVARRLGGETVFAARAGLQIGHVHRRAGRPAPALDAYLGVVRDARARADYRDEAWIWIGVLWSDAGRIEDARRAWRGVARGARDPVDRIHAFDRLAMSWLACDDLEAAAGVLDECRRAMARRTAEATPLGARTRRALGRMRVVRALPRRIIGRERSQGIPKGTPRKP